MAPSLGRVPRTCLPVTTSIAFGRHKFRVWNLIDAKADEALLCRNFKFISEESVALLVNRATLDVDEFFLYECIHQWATAGHERYENACCYSDIV